jgi:transglutaminase-like putative cysteine protease
MVAPAVPVQSSREVIVRQDGDGGPVTIFGLPDRVATGDSYTTTSMTPLEPDAPGALTQNRLAAASTDYPDWVVPYLSWTPASVGPWTMTRAKELVARLHGKDDPFHIATEMQAFLRTEGFSYQTSVDGLCRDGETVPDCLLRSQRGFCQQYATAMVMMLRVMNVPARYVEGYLPGVRTEAGTFEVNASAAHAWVEVYFPGYGWIPFDPTPGLSGNGDEATSFTEGPPVARSPRPDGSLPPTLAASPSPSPSDAAVPPPGSHDPDSGAPGELLGLPIWLVALVSAGLALLFGAVALLMGLRRFPGGSPEFAYRGVASLAARFGHGPKPTQTAYEFTSSLSDVVPGVTQDLHVVARARVESVYGRRSPEGEGVTALRSAYQHARVGLLRLVFRRGPRPGR